jgi:hypothetical protein
MKSDTMLTHPVTMDTVVRQLWGSIYNLEAAVAHQSAAILTFIEASQQRGLYTSDFFRNETMNQVENLVHLQCILMKKIVLCKKMFGFHFIEQYRNCMDGRALLNLQRSLQRSREKTSLHLVHAGLYSLICKLEDGYRSKHELLAFNQVESPQKGPKLFVEELIRCKTSFNHSYTII